MTENEFHYRGRSLQIVETKDYRWRVFENSWFVCESWSRDSAIDYAAEIIDRKLLAVKVTCEQADKFTLSSDAPRQAEQVDRVTSEIKLQGIKNSI